MEESSEKAQVPPMIAAFIARMKELGISQRALSASSGVSRAHIYRFLKGSHTHTSFYVVGAISRALSLDPAEMARLHFSSVPICAKGRHPSGSQGAP
jgi:predicted transcriptional regulator